MKKFLRKNRYPRYPHTLESKRRIIATLLCYEGHLRKAANELGYSSDASLCKVLRRWYPQHPGLESIIETARKRREKIPTKRKYIPDEDLVKAYIKSGFNTEKTWQITGKIYKNKYTIAERIKVIGRENPELLEYHLSQT